MVGSKKNCVSQLSKRPKTATFLTLEPYLNTSFIQRNNKKTIQYQVIFLTKSVLQGSFKKQVCCGWGRGSLKSEQKRTRGGGSQHVCSFAFLKKNAEIFKMKFYSSSPVFPVDYNGSMKYSTNHHKRRIILSKNGYLFIGYR